MDLFAGISVSDHPVAPRWYETLSGEPPEFSPNDTESVWQVAEHRFVHVEHRPAHAGRHPAVARRDLSYPGGMLRG